MGLILFSKLLEQLIKHYKSITISTLVGFILGSLGAVWPWTAKTIEQQDKLLMLLNTPNNQFYFPDLFRIDTLIVCFFILLGSYIVIQLERYGKQQKT